MYFFLETNKISEIFNENFTEFSVAQWSKAIMKLPVLTKRSMYNYVRVIENYFHYPSSENKTGLESKFPIRKKNDPAFFHTRNLGGR